MSKKATPDLLNQLHGLVAQDLIDKIKSGDATAQELSAAIKFLKDNHVEGDIQNNPQLKELTNTIFPDFQDEELE